MTEKQFVCETCTYPSRNGEHCDNPACLANPTLPETHKEKLRLADAKARAEREEFDQRQARKARLRAQGFTTAF